MIRKRMQFKVKGSGSEPHTVTFKRTGTNLTASCTCRAAKGGRHCSHRLSIMEGKTRGIVSKNAKDVDKVWSMVKGSDVEPYWHEVHALQDEIDELKKQLKEMKTSLLLRMQD